MEPFLTEEVTRKLAAEDVCQIPGKVLFNSSATINRISELKAAERLFLLLKEDSPVRLSAHISPGKAATVLQSRLLDDKNQWTKAVLTWSRLQGELQQKVRGTTALGIAVRENGAHTLEKKRKREEEEREVDKVKDVQSKTEEETIRHIETGIHIHWRPEYIIHVYIRLRGMKCLQIQIQEVSKVIGVGVSRLMGWKADLKNPQLEVNFFFLLLCLLYNITSLVSSRLPLANRSYIKTTGLRPTVAWAISSLAQIQPGFCVVDPMCGVGTILIEAAQEHKVRTEIYTVFLCVCQLQKLLPLPSASVDAVVCDLPFGRKFGTKTSMAANLPVIVTEMERFVPLFVFFSVVFSVNLILFTILFIISHQTSQIHCKVKSSSSQETSPQSELQHCLPPPLSSLKLQATVRVSLGAIDGLIHKYVKRDA
uniref:THUMP domain containing 2 n=1 Tax=Mastacembelus armatus TaxID=205130 RepID=A0A3Q3MY95_9TELE